MSVEGEPIRLLVIHEDRVVREALVNILARQHETVTLLGCLPTIRTLLLNDACQQRPPEVVLLGGRQGLSTLYGQRTRLQRLYPDTVVVLLGDRLYDSDRERGNVKVSSLVRVLTHKEFFRGVLRSLQLSQYEVEQGRPNHGGAEIDRHASRGAAHKRNLTLREQEIYVLRQQGMSNKEIACTLQIGVQTVKNHVHAVALKLRLSR